MNAIATAAGMVTTATSELRTCKRKMKMISATTAISSMRVSLSVPIDCSMRPERS